MSEFTLPANSKVGNFASYSAARAGYTAAAIIAADTLGEAERVTDEMFLTAAKAIAEQVSEENLAAELIYPPRERIFGASLHVAERVAACIFDQGLARVPRPADVGGLIRSRVYRPVYPE